MKIKELLKKNQQLVCAYRKWKKQRLEKNAFSYHGIFENRSTNAKVLCIMLAGYKPFLQDDVFGRLQAFQKENMDMCIVTSGLYSSDIAEVCKKNQWSYLSTKENNVSLVQNVAIHLHPGAQYIFKLDEDIFITKDYFNRMLQAYERAKNGEYIPGVMAPLLSINGYSNVRILEKLGLKDIYEKKFEKPKYAAGPDRLLEADPATARFFWGEGEYIPQIDDLNERFWKEQKRELACPVRFSIGAILFERSLWEQMGYFQVNRTTNAMGADEAQICSYCCQASRPVMVSENILAGHFSFGPQTQEMKKYYDENRERFAIHQTEQ